MMSCSSHIKMYPRFMFGLRMYSSKESITDVTNKISKILISSPKIGLDTVIDQNAIRASSEVVETVIKKFENAGMLAYSFFQWAGRQHHYEHTVTAYHYMIESLAKIRQYQPMWDLVTSMRKKGFLNIETFCIIMIRYARAKKVEEAVYTFNVMEKYDVTPNLAAFNGLLNALCKTKNVRKAQEIFDTMKHQFVPDSKTYSILLEGWGRDPNLPKARELFREMEPAGCPPDIVTYGIMVDTLCKAGRIEEAVEIIKEMNSRGVTPTMFIYRVLIRAYGLENRIEDAVNTFLEMERNGVVADVTSYNAMISAFCKGNKMQNVYRVLNEMHSKHVKPNSRTCNIIIGSLIATRDTDVAFKVFRKMIRICEPDDDTYTMMIKMFCGRDDLEMALKIWKYMKRKQFVPSMQTYFVLIEGLCDKGDVTEPCILMEEMIERGIRPRRHTFGKLTKLLLKQGRKDVLKFLIDKLNLLVKEPLYD